MFHNLLPMNQDMWHMSDDMVNIVDQIRSVRLDIDQCIRFLKEVANRYTLNKMFHSNMFHMDFDTIDNQFLLRRILVNKLEYKLH